MDNAPLHSPASSAGALNGLYNYGPSAFPTSSSSAANYWVDVSFTTTPPPDSVPPLVTAVDPVSGSTSVPQGAALKATFSEAIIPSTVVFTVNGPLGAVSGTTTYDPVAHQAIFTPTISLTDLTSYTATVSAASDLAGNALAAPASWTFQSAQPTGIPGTCPCPIWPDAVGPAQGSSADSQAIEVGTKFRADANGYVTGIRFYKGAANIGTHTATLWDSTGHALATGTITSESAAGWQDLVFPTSVAITAGVTYIASYHTSGHYAATVGAFASAGVDRGPLHALQSGVDGPNGVYVYGAGGIAPTNGNDTNYWVQPVYDTVPLNLPPVISAIAATGSGSTATVTWTTDKPSSSSVSYGLTAGSLTSTATGPSGVTSHTVSLTGLTPNSAYYFRVSSVDSVGNTTTAPAPPAAPSLYQPTTVPFTNTTAADFATGTTSTASVLAADDGEVSLTPTITSDLTGTTVPAGWTVTAWATGGKATVSGGSAAIDGARTGDERHLRREGDRSSSRPRSAGRPTRWLASELRSAPRTAGPSSPTTSGGTPSTR